MAHKPNNKKYILAASAAFLLGAIIAYIGFIKNNVPETITRDGKTLHRMEDYNPRDPGEISCDAALPECGYCPGVAEHNNCYVERKN